MTVAVAVAAEPPTGAYKTNVVGGSTSSAATMNAGSTPLLPLSEVFEGASFKAFQGSVDVTKDIFSEATATHKAGVRFQPGQVYVLVKDSPGADSEKAVRGRRPLPMLFGGLGRDKSGVTVPFTAQPYFIFGRVPMIWEGGIKSYASSLTVFYEVQPEGVTPPPTFAMPVHFDASNGTVQPADVTITPTEQSQRVQVRTSSFDRPVVVSIKAGGREFKSSITVSPELGTLRMTPAQAEIAGFGAGQTGLRIEGFDPLDRALVADEAMPVTFSIDGPATITPATATIAVGASGTDVILKSTGAGTVTVTAKSARGPIATAKVKLRPILGSLALRSEVSEITGFGSGRADIRVQRLDPAGQPLAGDDALPVSFTVTGPATVSPTTVTIPAGASEAMIVVQSSGFGDTTLTAAGGGKTSTPFKLGVRSVLGALKLTPDKNSISDFGAGQTDLVVQRLDPTGAPLSGEEPLLVTFAITGAGKLTPSTATIPAGQDSVKVNLKSTGEGAITVTASGSNVNSAEVKIALTRTTHRLSFTPATATALGYGFGRVKLTVTRQDAGGKEFADPQAATVPIQVGGAGTPEPKEIAFKPGESSTTVVVKGVGSGPAYVKAAGSLQSNQTTIEFVVPWALIVSTLLGCGLGAFLRDFKAKAQGAKSTSKKLILRTAAVAILIVAIGLGGGALGIVPQGLLAGLGGALLFGGILGLVGTYLVDMFMSPPAAA